MSSANRSFKEVSLMLQIISVKLIEQFIILFCSCLKEFELL